MTAESTITCSCCQTARPAAEVYEPVRGLGEYRCTDAAACRRRTAYIGDPVGEFVASPPPAVPGAACSICGATDPPGGAYQRTASTYVCLDRPGCDERAIETQYLTAQRDSYPGVAFTSAGMRHAIADAGTPAVTAGRPLEAAAAEQAGRDAAVQLAALARR